MMRSSTFAFVLLAASPLGLQAVQQGQTALASANPIRKVVNMLQAMQKKVEAEGEAEKKLFEQYMCYCKNSGGDLGQSISDAETRIPQLEADIKAGEAKKKQLDEDLKQHQADRSAAKTAMSDATGIRKKEAAEHAKSANEGNADIAATAKATAAVEKGMGAAFVQTAGGDVLKRVVQQTSYVQDADKSTLLSFLSGAQGEDYAPASGEIVGILKTMHDEMTADLNEEAATEAAAIKAYDELMAAKTKEVNALTKAIEEKMTRSGELAIEIVQQKNDLGDTAEALAEDKKFLADMEKNCATKAAEWEGVVQTRNEELLALADTIKVLNDDDALELFKKALPSASASFMQVQVTSKAMRARALEAIRGAHSRRPQMDFIALAIQGRKIGFENVIKMIEEMAATLKTEQADDDAKKEYCAKEFDSADDKKKQLERSIKDLETAIADAKDGIESTKEEIKALGAGIKALDKSVAEATAQRKEENEEFTQVMASDSAAKEILGFAKNRLNKFYNPKLYKAPPARELSDEDRATLAAGGTLAPTAAPGGIAGTGVTVLADVSEHSAPPPPPQAPGAHKKQNSGGVIAMIDLIVKDLDKEMTVNKAEEKDAQGDYEQMMTDSAEKRAEDSKSLGDKESALADLEAALEKDTESKSSTTKELGATLQYIQSLHSECDWLLQYFDVRKEARTSEIDALGKAKAVLSGADFSFVQVKTRHNLRHA